MFRIVAVLLCSIVLPLFAAEKPLEKVSLQLQWLDQFQFAGYYMAIEKGYYRDAGLELELKPFQQGLDPVVEVVNGNATYGTGRSSLLIYRIEKKPVVALAAILQSSPHVLLARRDSGIREIQDFKGKRVMLTRDAQDSVTYQAMLNAEGVSFDDLLLQQHTFDLDDLIERRTDLMASYISNEPFRMEEQQIESIGFAPNAYGFDFYSDILFTSENEVHNRPGRTKAFLMASLKGWAYAFEHIEETAQVIFERYNSQNKSRKSLIFEGEALKKLAYEHDRPLGHIAIEKFHSIYNLYRVMGMIDKPFENIEDFIYTSAINTPLRLTKEEKNYLRLNRIRTVTTGYGPPFKHSPLFHNGYPLTAIAHDIWMQIINRHGISADISHKQTQTALIDALKNDEADIALNIDLHDTDARDLLLSKPYGTFSYVIATRGDVNYIPSLSLLEEKRVAVRNGSMIHKQLRIHYPKLELIPVKDSDEAIKRLKNGDVEAVIDLLALLSHVIEHESDRSLKVSGTTEFSQPLRFAVNKTRPELLSIINKSIDAIPVHERNAMFNRYVVADPEHAVNFDLIAKIMIGVFIVIGALFYRQHVLERHNSDLLKMANTDKLTQTWNRLKLDESLDELINSYHRYHRSFVLILLDIDDFKKINDRHGHLLGDRALQSLADLLKKHLRKTDLLGRWGGEEFMIICQETDAEGGVKLADALRTIIESEAIEEIGSLSCSFGVTAMLDTDRAETVVKRVDDALYSAKQSGKNRVVLL